MFKKHCSPFLLSHLCCALLCAAVLFCPRFASRYGSLFSTDSRQYRNPARSNMHAKHTLRDKHLTKLAGQKECVMKRSVNQKYHHEWVGDARRAGICDGAEPPADMLPRAKGQSSRHGTGWLIAGGLSRIDAKKIFANTSRYPRSSATEMRSLRSDRLCDFECIVPAVLNLFLRVFQPSGDTLFSHVKTRSALPVDFHDCPRVTTKRETVLSPPRTCPPDAAAFQFRSFRTTCSLK